MPVYPINQFLVQSEIALPCEEGLPMLSRQTAEPLAIRHVESGLQQWAEVAWIVRREGGVLRSYAVGNGVLVCVWKHLRLHADTKGRTLTLDFDPSDPLAAGLAGICTINMGLSLCTLLRGCIPLHAAAAEVDGKLIGVMAPSGTGKTTLLWALLDQGAVFASDDVLSVKVQNGCVRATPSMSLPAKLSREALEARGEECLSEQEVYPGSEEFWVPMPEERRLLQARPLAALFVLRPFPPSELCDQVFVRRNPLGEAVTLLFENTQALWALNTQLDAKRMFGSYQMLARSVPVFTLAYPRTKAVLPRLIEAIRQTLCPGGNGYADR